MIDFYLYFIGSDSLQISPLSFKHCALSLISIGYLIRASPCQGEGREFESLHPLLLY